MSRARRVLITGASSGIGLALSRAFLIRGDQVLGVARHIESLQVLASEYGDACQAISADLTRSEDVDQLVHKIARLTDHLDVVILNAGTCEYLDIHNWDSGMFERVMKTNFFSAVHLVEVLLPFLRLSDDTEWGRRLVGTSSLVVRLPLPRAQAYGASKAALDYFWASLRLDLAKEGIGVSIVRPGFVRTPLTARNDFPMPLLMTPETAAVRIISGLENKMPLVEFPQRLVWLMRFVSCLPQSWQIKLLTQLSRSRS